MHLLQKLFPPNADSLRKKLAPNYSFLRNFKAVHRDRIQKAVDLGQLQGKIVLVDTAYDADGQPLPLKIAAYSDSPYATSLFYQFYFITKAEEKLRGKAVQAPSSA